MQPTNPEISFSAPLRLCASASRGQCRSVTLFVFRSSVFVAALLQCKLYYFRQMERFAPRALINLLAAAETVRKDECVGWCVAHRGQQHAFADRHRHLEFLSVEAEWT